MSTDRKSLKDIIDVFDGDKQLRDHVMRLLERGHEIKQLLGSDRDKKTGKPFVGDANYGLQAELVDIKESLCMLQNQCELDGFRFGKIGAVSSQMPGKEFLSVEKLLEQGVTPEQIRNATVRGDSYWKTDLFKLK